MLRILSIDSFVLDLESLSSMLPVTLLLELLKLFRAFCECIHNFLTGFISEEVDRTTGGLADNLLCALMLFKVISRVIIDLLQNVVIGKYGANDFIISLMSILTLRKLLRNFATLLLSSLYVSLIIFAELFLALSKLASAANDLFFSVDSDVFVDLLLDLSLTLFDVLGVGLDALHISFQVIILLYQAFVDNIVIITLDLAFSSGATAVLPGLFLDLVIRKRFCSNL